MENKFTPELIKKAQEAKNAEELAVLAKENGIELTIEEAKAYFERLQLKTGEISDDELDNVAGGGCGSEYQYGENPKYKKGNQVILSVVCGGILVGPCFDVQCTILDVRKSGNKWLYNLKSVKGETFTGEDESDINPV